VLGNFNGFVSEAAFVVGESAAKEFDDLKHGERFEDVNFGAEKKKRDDLEERILRGRANEHNVAGFNMKKKNILLRFVEAMDLVNENDGAVTGAHFVFGRGHDVFYFFDAGKDRAERDEVGVCEAGDETCKRGFAAAGKSPEEHRADVVVFDLQA